MGRVKRLKVNGESAYYHLMSRTVGGEFYFGDIEKGKLQSIIQSYSNLYFVKIIGFCILNNHFHLLVKSETGSDISDTALTQRLCEFYDKSEIHYDHKLNEYRQKLSDISEFMKSIKLTFTRWYNRINRRTGYLWGDRFKSVLVESGEALLNTLAYIDLNPIRAGIVGKPEDYRWSSIGYHIQSGNKDQFLSFEGIFALDQHHKTHTYRELVYQAGGIEKTDQPAIDSNVQDIAHSQHFAISTTEALKYRVRYFSDSLAIGSKTFIQQVYSDYGGTIIKKKDRKSHKTGITSGIFSVRNLAI